MGSTELASAVATLQANASAENSALSDLAQKLQAAEAQLQAAQAHATDLQTQLDSVTQTITAVATAAAQATASVQVEVPAPTDPTAAPVADPSAPAPAPTDPIAPPSERSVYDYTGADASTIDPNTWPAAPLHTEAGAQLYYYSGDAEAGAQTGNGVDGFQLYTGTTVAA